jgi:serine protease Do
VKQKKMKNVDLFDNYISNHLSVKERADFEALLKSDEELARAFSEHQQLLSCMQQQDEQLKLRKEMDAIHEKEFGKDARIISIHKEETFAKRYGKTAMVAASTALIAVLGTLALLSTGGYLLKKQNDQILDLRKVVHGLKFSQDAIVEGIAKGKAKQKAVYAPANFEGSAFAFNNQGYVLTSLHMIKDADSIFIQNSSTERTLSRVILVDEKLDLAVLKIENKDKIKNWQIPFSFVEKSAEIGEKVFTLGYPRKDMVYGEGSLSALSGFSNDTSMYQISIPVNPGNSGGPLLDEQGNVIGVIRGKITSAEATGFAIKSREIIRSINALGKDTIQTVNKRPALRGMKRTEQIKKINPYVFNVLVYKKD